MNILAPEYASFYVGAGQFSICDWEDWPLVCGYWWRLTTDKGDVRYAQTWSTHNQKTRKRITMHGILVKPPEGMTIDHINGNGLDNRRQNLRLVTPQQNTWNRRPWARGTSKFKGVSWDKETKHWRADIKAGGKNKYLGRFSSEEEAAHAYKKAAELVYGEFAFGNRNV